MSGACRSGGDDVDDGDLIVRGRVPDQDQHLADGCRESAAHAGGEGEPRWLGANATITWTGACGVRTETSSERLDEPQPLRRCKMEGSPVALYRRPLHWPGLNTVTVPETTPGVPAAKSPILPDPNLGGFTTSNPAGALPHQHHPTEDNGSASGCSSRRRTARRSSPPRPRTSYQETLATVQTNTVYGFVQIPNAQIPRDINIVSFRILELPPGPGSSTASSPTATTRPRSRRARRRHDLRPARWMHVHRRSTTSPLR